MPDAGLRSFRRLTELLEQFGARPDLESVAVTATEGAVEVHGLQFCALHLVREDGSVELRASAGAQPLQPDSTDLTGWRERLGPAADGSEWIAALRSPAGETLGLLVGTLAPGAEKPDESWQALWSLYVTLTGSAIHHAQMLARVEASDATFQLAFDRAPVAMSVTDLRTGNEQRILRANEAMCRALGYSQRDLVGRSTAEITHPEDLVRETKAIRTAVMDQGDRYAAEKRYLRRDGTSLWVALQTAVVRDAQGGSLYGISHFEDISDRRAEHQELRRRALVDPLTGLPNRSVLVERLEAAHREARATGRAGEVLFCDLDDFKPVNDSHGHAFGDQVLVIIAKRLEAQIRSGDTIARLGGDEFVVVTEDLTEDAVQELMIRLQSAVSTPLTINDETVTLSVTVGRAHITGTDGETPTGLIAAADVDMYRQKAERDTSRRGRR